MKSINLTLFTALLFMFAGCGQNEDSSADGQVSELQQYTPQNGTVHLMGNIENAGDIGFILMAANLKDTLQTFTAPQGELAYQIEGLAVNEIYMLEISGVNVDDRGANINWWYTLPIFLENGAELSLSPKPIAGADDYSTPYSFTIEGSGEEQQFLESWYRDYSVVDMQESNRAARNARINQEYINRESPLISTLFLISQQTDHRSNMDSYMQVYDKAPEHVKNSRYGIDLANRIYRINNYTTEIDMEELLAARTSQLYAFTPANHRDKSHWLLVFWASWDPTATIQVPTIHDLVQATGNTDIEVLYFSLDTRMSQWKPTTDEMQLPNSYMLRAEVRQQAIDQLYLTELPRYMIITPDGKVVENDLTYDELEAVIKAL